MKRFLDKLLGGHLLVVLIVCLSLVAALTVGVFALVTSRVTGNYLAAAYKERVARDYDHRRNIITLRSSSETLCSTR